MRSGTVRTFPKQAEAAKREEEVKEKRKRGASIRGEQRERKRKCSAIWRISKAEGNVRNSDVG
jgi:hypothetical protein